LRLGDEIIRKGSERQESSLPKRKRRGAGRADDPKYTGEVGGGDAYQKLGEREQRDDETQHTIIASELGEGG